MALVSLPSQEWESEGGKGVSTWHCQVQHAMCQEEKFILLTIVSDFHFPQLAGDAIFRSA